MDTGIHHNRVLYCYTLVSVPTFTVKSHNTSTSKRRKDIVVGRQGQKECEWDQPETECEVSQYLDKTRHEYGGDATQLEEEHVAKMTLIDKYLCQRESIGIVNLSSRLTYHCMHSTALCHLVTQH